MPGGEGRAETVRGIYERWASAVRMECFRERSDALAAVGLG